MYNIEANLGYPLDDDKVFFLLLVNKSKFI